MQLGRNLKEVMPVSTWVRCVGQEGQCRVDTLCSHQNKELGVARTKGEEVVYWLTFANLNDYHKIDGFKQPLLVYLSNLFINNLAGLSQAVRLQGSVADPGGWILVSLVVLMWGGLSVAHVGLLS